MSVYTPNVILNRAFSFMRLVSLSGKVGTCDAIIVCTILKTLNIGNYIMVSGD